MYALDLAQTDLDSLLMNAIELDRISLDILLM